MYVALNAHTYLVHIHNSDTCHINKVNDISFSREFVFYILMIKSSGEVVSSKNVS